MSRLPDPMNARRLFDEFAAECRVRQINGYELDVLPCLSRYTSRRDGAEGFVAFARLPAGSELAVIDEQIDYFDRIGQPFEWKVYEFDSPATLKPLLEARGFTCDAGEAFLIRQQGRELERAPELRGIRIARAADESGVRDAVSIQEAIYGQDFGWVFDGLARSIGDGRDDVAVFCAYAGDRPVGCGWIDFPPNSSFAELHGGSVLPEFRGRGIFSALLAERVREAGRRGCPYLIADAAPMSRPILLGKGFEHICLTWPMRRMRPPR